MSFPSAALPRAHQIWSSSGTGRTFKKLEEKRFNTKTDLAVQREEPGEHFHGRPVHERSCLPYPGRDQHPKLHQYDQCSLIILMFLFIASIIPIIINWHHHGDLQDHLSSGSRVQTIMIIATIPIMIPITIPITISITSTRIICRYVGWV